MSKGNEADRTSELANQAEGPHEVAGDRSHTLQTNDETLKVIIGLARLDTPEEDMAAILRVVTLKDAYCCVAPSIN